MDTHHLAAHLRNTRRPSHLGESFFNRAKSAGKAAGTALIDSAQQSAGDYAEEKLTDLTGNEAIGQASRAAIDAGVDEAQGQTPQQPQQRTIDPNTLLALRSVAPLLAQRRIAPIDFNRLKNIRSGLATHLITPVNTANTANQQLIVDPEPESPEPTTESAEGDGKKKALIIGGSILALALIGGGVFFATRKK